MVEILHNTKEDISPSFVDLNVITCYSTFFAEWLVRDNDVVVHLFPRNGADDIWEEGHYINRCKKCDREVRDANKPCVCGHKGLVYIHGRKTQPPKGVIFPDNISQILESVLNKHWMGSASIESTKEILARTDNDLAAPIENDIGAWVLQICGAYNGDENQATKLLEKIFDSIDSGLENPNAV